VLPDDRSWPDFDAVLFDLDGVLTPTADVHRAAWKEMFDEFLATRSEPAASRPFEESDYLAEVDGKPRYDGVRSFLASRGIELPEGTPSDEPGHGSVCALGNRKNALFNEVLRRDGIEPYPGSVRLLDHLAGLGIGMAVVSSSQNANDVLAAAGLADRFDVVVEGKVAARDHIAGKPAPDMFLAAADRLDAGAGRAVVVEDAVSGVEAGRNGRFALVVGVDRGAGRAALEAHGADVVVDDLDELVPG